METGARSPHPTFLDTFRPFDTGFNAALIFLLSHLILTPASGRVRLGSEGLPCLDAFRIGHPSQSGWFAYLAYGFVAAMALGAIVGATHWVDCRRVRSGPARYLLGLVFMLIAATAGFLSPLFLHRFPRRPIPPMRASPRTEAATAASDPSWTMSGATTRRGLFPMMTSCTGWRSKARRSAPARRSRQSRAPDHPRQRARQALVFGAGMEYHTDDEKALIASFRAAGGERFIFFRRGVPRLPRPTAEALARLVRSGHIRRHASGDFDWVSYRLRERDEGTPG